MRKMFRIRGLILATIALCAVSAPLLAGFIEDGACIYTGTFEQTEPRIAPDGMGGAFIVWQDEAGGYRIVAQRIDHLGHLLWPEDGIIVCDESMEQYDPLICSDGVGGAIIAWGDNRNRVYEDEWDIYGQRLDSDGVPQWTDGGVEICTTFGSQWLADLVSDGLGGAIIAWEDWSAGTISDLYLQRIGPGGVKIWGPEGVLVSDIAGSQELPSLLADGAGGAIVAYQEDHVGWNIYAQRIGSGGQLLWLVGGVPICVAVEGQYEPEVTTDGAGGAVIVWNDYRRGDFRNDLYAQRVNASGAVQWTVNGVAVCTAAENQEGPVLVPDGGGGAIIAWGDWRNFMTSGEDIYAQRLDGSGVRQWQMEGVPVCTATNYQWYQQIVSDDAGGAIVVWSDWRTGVVGNYDIYAQRIDQTGALCWDPNGISVSTADGEQGDATVLADGAGGMFVAWEDDRWLDYDIYALRIAGDGKPVATLLVQYTARFDGKAVCLEWTLSEPVGDRSFVVMRAPAGESTFEELEGIAAVRDDRICSYTDDDCVAGEDYCYRVYLVEGGERSLLFETGTVGVPAMALTLHQNHPNPFNPSTTIAYFLPERCRVRLAVYDVLGRVVGVLVDREEEMGPHSVHWDGLDSDGRGVPAGVYLYLLEAGKMRISKKMIAVR
jgi:hypothetical protein